MPDLRQACTSGKPSEDTAPSDALVLFGAMGDLAHKKIFPALYHMVRRGHLDLPVIGVARAARRDEHLKERVRDSIQRQGGDIDQEALDMIQRAEPLPAFAPSMKQETRNFVLPIRFHLN